MSKNLKEKRMHETKMMNCGIEATIIDYREILDIDVKFSTGELRTGVTYQNFEIGKISPIHRYERDYESERLHEKKKMNCGQKLHWVQMLKKYVFLLINGLQGTLLKQVKQ